MWRRVYNCIPRLGTVAEAIAFLDNSSQRFSIFRLSFRFSKELYKFGFKASASKFFRLLSVAQLKAPAAHPKAPRKKKEKQTFRIDVQSALEKASQTNFKQVFAKNQFQKFTIFSRKNLKKGLKFVEFSSFEQLDLALLLTFDLLKC